jgi:hypothetical protein
MNKPFTLLCLGFANTVLLAQLRPANANAPVTPSHSEIRRVLRRSFPPDVIVPPAHPLQVKSSRSYCVYPLLDTGSLSIAPCRKAQPTPHLVAPFQKVSPVIKPLILPK